MARRKHNCDTERTTLAGFADRRSYWTHRGHCYRFGADVKHIREFVQARDQGFCQGCKVPHYVGQAGEMDHIKGGNTDDRCDCAENLRWVCVPFHRKKHVHIKSGKKA
jgi:5-methylcytosine-specific restriction endonuclease McrA